MNNNLFLLGYPKSGTTLLLSLLDMHPELCVFPEEIKFFQLVLKEKTFNQKIECLFERSGAGVPGKFNEVNFKSGTRDYSHINSDDYTKKLNEYFKLSKTDSDLFFSVYRAYESFIKTDASKFKYRVEKTPFNELYLDQINSLFPGSKCLQIIRDPRDNFNTYKKKAPNLTVEQFCNHWQQSTNVALANKSNENFLTIRYEDLVTDTKAIMEQIASFLDIGFSDILLSPSRSGSSWSGNSMFNENSKEGVHSKGIGRYKQNENSDEWRLVEAYLIDEIIGLGYEYQKETKKKSLKMNLFLNKVKRKLKLQTA